MRHFYLLILILTAVTANAVTLSVSPTPQTVANGQTVTVDIRVFNFTNMAGYQFSMNWDPAVLQLQSVTPAVPGMSLAGNFNISNSAAGVLTHLFFASSPNALTLPDGSALFALNFVAIGTAGTSSPINFGSIPTPIVAYNTGLQAVPVTTLSGIVHIAAQAGFAVTGNISRASGTPVPDVQVALTGDATGSDLTDAPGDYGFANLATGSNLTLSPAKTADALECVSVRDILFISKHILGLAPLSNPYQMVGADANQSHSITTFDAVELRKLILGIYSELPNAPSWQFIPADFIFSDPQNPFLPPAYPDVAEITDLQADAVRDFVAIKTGDATDCVDDTHGPAFLTALASSAIGLPGQQVTVDVTVQDFAAVLGMQFSMQWDPAVAQFAGVSNYTLPGMDAGSFNIAQAASGKLSLCWWTDLIAGGPQTLPNSTVLFSLTFTLAGPVGSSTPVTFVQTPTRFEVVDGNCDPFGLNVSSGLISVVSQLPVSLVHLVSGNATSYNGAPVCVPVSTVNFTNVATAQFTLAWDPAKFSFQQLQNLNATLGLTAGNINTTQSGTGVLTFAWLDPNAGGVTLPTGAILFEVCFTPLGSPGSSTLLSFPNSPVPIEFADSNLDALPVQTGSGTLTIAAANANNPVTLSVSPTPQTVAGGQTVTVDIRVSNFTDMAGYQFSMYWDPAVLQLQSVTPAVPGMSLAGNFNIGNSANGVLTHLFFASSPNALTLPDGAALFALNFVAIGTAGTSSPINFGSIPTPIVAYNTGLQAVPVTTLSGIVHIAAQAGFAVSGNISRASGTPVPDVQVAMTGDATGSDLTGAPGDYVFVNLAPGSDLTLTPAKTADPLECVSVRDILFIFKHILGIAPLPNPYQMVGADANRSHSITTFDAVELRKLILGIYTELPNAPSWQFIPEDYIFPNPNNPFQEPVPASAGITDLQADAVRDFVAIKTGDATDCVDDTHGPAFMTTMASSASGTHGQQVTIDVTVQNFADVSGLQFSMQWNPAVAGLDQFSGVTNLNPALPGLTDQAFNTTQAASGKLSLCWWTDLIAGPQALPNGAVLFSLTFTLVGPSGSSTPVAFVQTPTKVEVVNGNCDPFELNTDNGQISITGQPPPPPASLQFVSGNATSVNGAAVCVPVCTSNFTDIVSAQFSLGWDPAVFGFQQVQNFHPALSGLNGSNFFTGQSGTGLLGFGWYDLTASRVTLPNGAVLFEVCFIPLGPNGSSTPLGFPNAPVPLEIADEAGVIVPAQTAAGTLNIVSSGAAPITLAVLPTPQTVPSGSPVSVDIRVEDFTDIVGYQFSMNWDPTVLQLQSVTPVLPGVGAGANVNLGNSASGVLTHLFYVQGVTPLNLPDGSVLFTLNFLAVGAPGTSSVISFGGTPTPIAAYNSGLQAVPVTTYLGTVNIAAPADLPTQLLASSATSVGGALVCTQISMNGFTEIISAQFTVAWDPSKFAFQQVQNFNPAMGLSNGYFTTAQAGNGLLGFSWSDQQAIGITLPNTPVLFEACFTPVGPVGAVSSVGFPGQPWPVEIVKDPGGPLPVQTINGMLTIAGTSLPCEITCPSSVPALTANSSCQASLGDYTGLVTVSGDCIGPIVQTPPPGTLVNPGTVAITLTVSDTAGQSATCVFNVTISGGCGGN